MKTQYILTCLIIFLVSCGMSKKESNQSDDKKQKTKLFTEKEITEQITPLCQGFTTKTETKDKFGKTLKYAVDLITCKNPEKTEHAEFSTYIDLVDQNLKFTKINYLNDTSEPSTMEKDFRSEVITNKYVKLFRLCRKIVDKEEISNTEDIGSGSIRQFSFFKEKEAIQIKILDYNKDEDYPHVKEMISMIPTKKFGKITLPTDGFVIRREIHERCPNPDHYGLYATTTIDYL